MSNFSSCCDLGGLKEKSLTAKMSQKSQFWFWLAATALTLTLGNPVRAQTVLETIEETGVLKVAIREDAAPFGYLDSNDQLQGYCVDFVALLEEKLEQELSRQAIAIRLLKSTISNRFQLVEQGLAYLECGANTVKPLSSAKVTFSRPFFQTGTQFLVDARQKLTLDRDLENVKIGVIKNSTNEAFLRENYPSATLIPFYGTTARYRGLQGLQQGKITAMASDGILLQAEAAQQNLSLTDYKIIPQQPIEKSFYALILTGGDETWKNFIDSVINSPEGAKLFSGIVD